MDEDDMAWGTQAQIAIDSQTQEQSPKSDKGTPKINRKASTQNFTRCFPEEPSGKLLQQLPAGRMTYLGGSLHDGRHNSRHRCRAMPLQHDTSDHMPASASGEDEECAQCEEDEQMGNSIAERSSSLQQASVCEPSYLGRQVHHGCWCSSLRSRRQVCRALPLQHSGRHGLAECLSHHNLYAQQDAHSSSNSCSSHSSSQTGSSLCASNQLKAMHSQAAVRLQHRHDVLSVHSMPSRHSSSSRWSCGSCVSSMITFKHHDKSCKGPGQLSRTSNAMLSSRGMHSRQRAVVSTTGNAQRGVTNRQQVHVQRMRHMQSRLGQSLSSTVSRRLVLNA